MNGIRVAPLLLMLGVGARGAAQAPAQATARPKRPMTVADVLSLQDFGTAAIDSAGSAIALVVQRPRAPGELNDGEQIYRGNLRADVVVLSASTGRELFRTPTSAQRAGYWRPTWSPDGRRLAMLRLERDSLGIAVWDRVTRRVTRVLADRVADYKTQVSVGTNTGFAATDAAPFTWLSDSTLLVAVTPRGESDRATVIARAVAESVSVTWARQHGGREPSASILDELWPSTRTTVLSELFIINTVSGTGVVAARVPWWYQGRRAVVLSPDRRRAAVLGETRWEPARTAPPPEVNRPYFAATVEVASMVLGDTALRSVPEQAYLLQARWGTDGRRFAVSISDTSTRRAGRSGVVWIDAVTGAAVPPAPGEHAEGSPRGPSGNGAAEFGQRAGDRFLAIAPTRRFAIVRRSSSSGTAVWQLASDGGPPRLLMQANTHLASVAEARRASIRYLTRGGSVEQGAVLLPVSYRPGLRYPTVVWVYPGPGLRYTDTSTAGFLTDRDDPLFPLNPYLLAANGYVVLFPTMPYPDLDRVADGYDHMLDGVNPAIDSLIAAGIADSTRLAVLGVSHGGYAVNCIVTQTSRFRAAVSLAGMTDLVSYSLQFLGGTQYTQYPSPGMAWTEGGHGHLGAPPWEAPDRYLHNSPIMHVDRVTTPILVVSGDNDYVEQAEEWFTALQRAGKRSRLVRYWGEQHWERSPANIAHLWGQVLGWLDIYVRGVDK